MVLNPSWLSRPKIFISSTMEELNRVYRDKIITGLINRGFDSIDFLDNDFPYTNKADAHIIQETIDAVKTSDLYLLILGQRYGYIYHDNKSVVHYEYEEAINNNIPIIIFIQESVWREFEDNRTDRKYIENDEHFQFIKQLARSHRINPFQHDDECITHFSAQLNNLLGNYLRFQKNAYWLWDKNKTISVEVSAKEIWIITPDFFYDYNEPEKFVKVQHNILENKCIYYYIYKDTMANNDKIAEMNSVYKKTLIRDGKNPDIIDHLLHYLPVAEDAFYWTSEHIIFNPGELDESAIVVDIMDSTDKSLRFNIEMGRSKRNEFRKQFITFWNNHTSDPMSKI